MRQAIYLQPVSSEFAKAICLKKMSDVETLPKYIGSMTKHIPDMP